MINRRSIFIEVSYLLPFLAYSLAPVNQINQVVPYLSDTLKAAFADLSGVKLTLSGSLANPRNRETGLARLPFIKYDGLTHRVDANSFS